MELFRINFDAGGYAEDPNPQVLRDMRILKPGHIVKFKRTWAIANDPQMRVIDDVYAAEQAALQLGAEMFPISSRDEMDVPQPEGLNDPDEPQGVLARAASIVKSALN